MKKNSIILGIFVFILYGNVNSKSINADTIKSIDPINFAVLNNTVDNNKHSDHTLIEATIIEGKYKGTKLTGKLEHVQGPPKIAKQHRLVFTSMHVNGIAESIKITAYAIDPDTARTALISKVDEKYLSRNGSILAVSFIQSYSKPWHTAPKDNQAKVIMPEQVKIDLGTKIGILFMPKKV